MLSSFSTNLCQVLTTCQTQKKVKESEVTQSCLTLCSPMDCSLLGSSVHGILQARVLEWVAISFSRRSFQPRNWTQVYSTVQLSSITQSCPTFCDPMNHSTPGLPVHHQLPESTQSHVHWVGNAIQPSHPLSSPSPPALNLSQHQGLFKWPFSALCIRWPK